MFLIKVPGQFGGADQVSQSPEKSVVAQETDAKLEELLTGTPNSCPLVPSIRKAIFGEWPLVRHGVSRPFSTPFSKMCTSEDLFDQFWNSDKTPEDYEQVLKIADGFPSRKELEECTRRVNMADKRSYLAQGALQRLEEANERVTTAKAEAAVDHPDNLEKLAEYLAAMDTVVKTSQDIEKTSKACT